VHSAQELRDRGLLEKHGAGNRTHHTLNTTVTFSPQTALPGMEATKPGSQPSMSSLEGCKLSAVACNPELATFLGKDRHYLRNKHRIPMVREGQLRFRYPETAKHPHQAYVAAGDENKA
jgi:ATP-dependent DNA helicase RecG